MASIGNNLRLLRERKGLNQKEFAESIDVSAPTISAIENGGRLPSFNMLIRLADGLGVTTDELAREHLDVESVSASA